MGIIDQVAWAALKQALRNPSAALRLWATLSILMQYLRVALEAWWSYQDQQDTNDLQRRALRLPPPPSHEAVTLFQRAVNAVTSRPSKAALITAVTLATNMLLERKGGALLDRVFFASMSKLFGFIAQKPLEYLVELGTKSALFAKAFALATRMVLFSRYLSPFVRPYQGFTAVVAWVVRRYTLRPMSVDPRAAVATLEAANFTRKLAEPKAGAEPEPKAGAEAEAGAEVKPKTKRRKKRARKVAVRSSSRSVLPKKNDAPPK